MKYKTQLSFLFLFFGLVPICIAQNILFIRGGSGTGGFLEGGADEQLCDINDKSTRNGNHGWYTLAETLRGEGYTLEQQIEGPADNNTPIPLSTMDLSQYSVIVFGSNNAEYSGADADAVQAFIKNGGAALFISDANWGRNWGDAPSSDQTFLDRFGLVMNQDRGTYVLRRSSDHFIIAGDNRGSHPILNGIDSFDGEGVSPITLQHDVQAVDAVVLAEAVERLRQNDSYSQGTLRNPTADDGALVVADYGLGRIACHFDRNTFFNQNGAGTDIHRFDNQQYAINLFAWLAGKTTFVKHADNVDRHLQTSVYPTPTNSTLRIEFSSGYNDRIQLAVYNALGIRIAILFAGTITANQHYRFSFNFATHSTGIYFIDIRGRHSSVTRRILYAK